MPTSMSDSESVKHRGTHIKMPYHLFCDIFSYVILRKLRTDYQTLHVKIILANGSNTILTHTLKSRSNWPPQWWKIHFNWSHASSEDTAVFSFWKIIGILKMYSIYLIVWYVTPPAISTPIFVNAFHLSTMFRNVFWLLMASKVSQQLQGVMRTYTDWCVALGEENPFKTVWALKKNQNV